jgi:WD40 repeat protein
MPVPALDYATPRHDRPHWGPILFLPSGRTLLLTLLTAATALWLARRHEPWRHVVIPVNAEFARIVFTPSGKLLVLDHHTARVFDPETGRFFHALGERLPGTAAHRPDILSTRAGREVVKVHGDHIVLYDTDTGATLGTYERPKIDGARPRVWFASAPTGRKLVLEAERVSEPDDPESLKSVRFYTWDLDAPRAAPLPAHPFPGSPGTQTTWDATALAVLNPSDRRTPRDPAVRLFDAATGNPIPLDPLPPAAGTFDAFSADPNWMVLTDLATLNFWIYSVRTGKRLSVISKPAKVATHTPVEPSPEGRYIAHGRHPWAWTDPSLDLYDPSAPAAPIASRTILGSNLVRPRFSPDGTRLFARADGNGQSALYDLPRLRTVARLPGPLGLYDATFSPDGLHLASRGTDGHLHVYNKVGLECRESPLGLLGMPHAWLLLVLLPLTAFSLQSDARRRGAADSPTVLTTIATVLLLAALPRTAQATLSACMGHLLLTPAPILLLSAIGLATHSRFWRVATLVALAITAAVELHCLLHLHRTGLASTTTLPFLDRSFDAPTWFLAIPLALAVPASLTALLMISLTRSRTP